MRNCYSSVIPQAQAAVARDCASLFPVTPPTTVGLSKQRLQQAIDYMQAHLGEDISVADIAAQICISQYHFARLFKQSTGVTAHAYLIEQRVDKARQLLRQTELTVLDIADQCGFANPSHLAKHFQKHTGLTPRQFRQLVC
jgi:AraC family transcriptional regulator